MDDSNIPGVLPAVPGSRLNRRRPRPLALEQRFVFDGAAGAEAVEALAEVAPAPVEAAEPAPAHSEPAADLALAFEAPELAPPAVEVRELLFVDSGLGDVSAMLGGLREGVQVVVLEAGRDAWQQIADTLAGYSGLSAVHLVSHGSEGALILGGTRYDTAALLERGDQFAQWQASLAAGADILLYGCDVAAGEAGGLLLESLARLTQADVSGSSDSTGAAALGGNWVLERQTGTIETQALQFDDFEGLLAITYNQSGTVSTGTTIEATTSLTGAGATTWQWYRNSTNSTSGAVAISGATAASYTTTSSDLNHYVYAIATKGGNSDGPTSYIRVENVNTAPVLAAPTSPGAVAELANASAQDLAAITGTLSVSDGNVGDTLTPSVVGSPVVQLNGVAYTLPAGASALTAAGAFSFTTTSLTANGSSQSIGYRYDPAAANLDFLAAGDTLTIAYTVRVSDGTANSTDRTLTFTITGSNDAPVLDAAQSPALATLAANTGAPTGGSTAGSTLVSALLGGVSDADRNALQGIAITATGSQGTLYYSLNGGTTWTQVGAVSASSALLLDATARLYFQPNAGVHGTFTDALTFRAWDRSSGTAGNKVDTQTNGGTSAFSAATDTVQVTVNRGPIDLASNSDWVPILLGANFDYNNDTQAAAAKGVDLVGDASNALLSMQYNAGLDELAFRIRQETVNVSGVFYLLGILGTPASSTIDFFIGVFIPSSGATPTVRFYDAGSGLNNSPSTSSFNPKTAVAPANASVVISSTGQDLDSNGAIDGFVSFKFKASDLVAYANTAAGGQTGYTLDSAVAFVLMTATQTNSINGDIGGIQGSSSQTYAQLGIVTPITFSNQAPSAGNDSATLAEDTPYVFHTSRDFDTFSDPNSGDTLQAVRITSLPANGTLQYQDGNGNWVAVSLNQTLAKADIDAGKLRFVPSADWFGTTSFGFQVSDGKSYSAGSYAFALTVTPVNDAPAIARLDGDLSYWTTNGQAIAIDAFPAVQVRDIDSPDFAGGVLSLAVSGGLTAHNQLTLVATGGVTLSGSNVLYNGVQVATLSGAGTASLSLALNANATPAVVAELLGAVRYTYLGSEQAPAVRTLTVQVTDGDGGTSNLATVTLVGPPVYAFQGTEDTALGFAAADVGIAPGSSVSITDVAAGAGSFVFQRNGVSTVLATGQTLTAAEYDTLVYHPGADVYGDGVARLAFRFIGAPGGIYDSNGLSYQQPIVTVNLAPVNDAPVVDLNGGAAGTGSSQTYVEIDGADETWNAVALVAPGTVNLSDIDSERLSALSLSGTAYAGDQILVGGTTLALGSAASGSLVVGGQTFSYLLTPSGSQFTLVFESASPLATAHYEALLDALRFNNTSDTPDETARVFSVVARDEQGASSVAAQATVQVQAVNDTPTLDNVAPTAQYDYGRDNPVALLPDALLADRDGRVASVSLVIADGQAGDLLSFASTSQVQAHWDAATFTLTLTGQNGWTTADLQAALRQVTFSTSLDSAGTRTVDVVATDDGAPAKSTAVGSTQVALVDNSPVLSAVTPLSYTDTAVADSFADRTGTLSATSGASYLIAGQETGSYSVGGASYDQRVTGTYGVLYLDGASGAYRYVPDSARIDALPAGSNPTDSFVLVARNASGTDSQTLVVQLHGANDTASISGSHSGGLSEDGVTSQVGGTLAVADRDTGEASFRTPSSLAGQYGVFTFDGSVDLHAGQQLAGRPSAGRRAAGDRQPDRAVARRHRQPGDHRDHRRRQ